MTEDSEVAFYRGRLEGKLEAMGNIQNQHHERLEKQDRRIALLEKVMWMLLGAIALIQVLPIIKAVLER